MVHEQVTTAISSKIFLTSVQIFDLMIRAEIDLKITTMI